MGRRSNHSYDTNDPYTVGHQYGVAHLSIAIAKEIGLENEKIQGLKLAATLHDVGKIGIPISILVKPTKLTIWSMS